MRESQLSTLTVNGEVFVITLDMYVIVIKAAAK